MTQFIILIYYNGRIFESLEGVTFEGLKRAIQIERGTSYDILKQKIHTKLKLQPNQIISSITCRFLASVEKRKYTALQICDDEDVECMISNFQQHSLTTVLEIYVEIYVESLVVGGQPCVKNQRPSCNNDDNVEESVTVEPNIMPRKPPKRSRTRGASTSIACSTLNFQSPEHQEVYEQIRHYPFFAARYIEDGLLDAYHIEEKFQQYILNIGWQGVYHVRCAAYCEPTLEFLSTFLLIVDLDGEEPTRIRFQLNGQEFTLTLAEFNIRLGFETEESVLTKEYLDAHEIIPSTFSSAKFWAEIASGRAPYNPRHSKASRICDPVLRLAHRWLAHTIEARGDSTGVVSNSMIFFLYCMVKGKRCNAGRFLLARCERIRQRVKAGTVKSIAIGTYISHLAQNLNALHPHAQQIATMTPISHSTLQSIGVIRPDGPGRSALSDPDTLAAEQEAAAGIPAHELDAPAQADAVAEDLDVVDAPPGFLNIADDPAFAHVLS